MSVMRVVVGLFIASGCLLCVAAAPEKSEREKKLEEQNAALAQALADARDENARLKEKVRELERKLTQRQTRVVPQPAPVTPTQPVPKDWVSKEFNGQPYYLIPLQGSN